MIGDVSPTGHVWQFGGRIDDTRHPEGLDDVRADTGRRSQNQMVRQKREVGVDGIDAFRS